MNNSKWEMGRAFKAEETVNSEGPESRARAEAARKKSGQREIRSWYNRQ